MWCCEDHAGGCRLGCQHTSSLSVATTWAHADRAVPRRCLTAGLASEPARNRLCRVNEACTVLQELCFLLTADSHRQAQLTGMSFPPCHLTTRLQRENILPAHPSPCSCRMLVQITSPTQISVGPIISCQVAFKSLKICAAH